MKYNIDNPTICFKNETEYLDFVYHIADKQLDDTILACSEDVASHFGIQFGTHEDIIDGNFLRSPVEILIPEIQPKEYPCFLLTYCLRGMTYMGRKYGYGGVKYSDEPVYLYISDFKFKI